MYSRRRPKTPLHRLKSLPEVSQDTPPNTPIEFMAQLYAGLGRKGLLKPWNDDDPEIESQTGPGNFKLGSKEEEDTVLLRTDAVGKEANAYDLRQDVGEDAKACVLRQYADEDAKTYGLQEDIDGKAKACDLQEDIDEKAKACDLRQDVREEAKSFGLRQAICEEDECQQTTLSVPRRRRDFFGQDFIINPVDEEQYSGLSPKEQGVLDWIRSNEMHNTYCVVDSEVDKTARDEFTPRLAACPRNNESLPSHEIVRGEAAISSVAPWSKLVDDYYEKEAAIVYGQKKLRQPERDNEIMRGHDMGKEWAKSENGRGHCCYDQDLNDVRVGQNQNLQKSSIAELGQKVGQTGMTFVADNITEVYNDKDSDVFVDGGQEWRSAVDENLRQRSDTTGPTSWGELVEEFKGRMRLSETSQFSETSQSLDFALREKLHPSIDDQNTSASIDGQSEEEQGVALMPGLMSQSWIPGLVSDGDEDDSVFSAAARDTSSLAGKGIEQCARLRESSLLVVGNCSCPCCRRWAHGGATYLEHPACQVDERKLKPKAPSPPDPHEQLLRDIRSQPKLKPVRQGRLVVETSRTRLNEEDELEPALPVKRVIKADLNLLLNSSFEESSDDDDVTALSTPSVSSPSSPAAASTSGMTESMASQVTWRRAATRDALMNDANTQRPSKLQRRHTIMVCESPIDGKVLSGELPPLAEEEDEPSPIKESHSLASLHSGLRPNPSHPLVPKPSYSDHDLQSQVTLRHPPGQTRRLSLEHRRSLTSLPTGLSAIPEMDDCANGAEGSLGSRPSNLFRRSWSTEQAPPPNPSPPCKARVRASASMSMAGSKPRSGLSHSASSQHQQKPLGAPSAKTAASSQSAQSSSCMPGGGRPPSYFPNASFNFKNSENGSSNRHASRGPGLVRHSSLPSAQHVSVTLNSSKASSVASSLSSSSSPSFASSSSHTPSTKSSQTLQGPPLSASQSSSSRVSSTSTSSTLVSSPQSQPSKAVKESETRATPSSPKASEQQSKLDTDVSSQSPFFTRSMARLAAAREQGGSQQIASSTHTVIEPAAQRQAQTARWRNPNAREERLMRRQGKPGTSPSLNEGGSNINSQLSSSSSPSLDKKSEATNIGDHQDSEDALRPRRRSLDSGVNLYRDATNVSVRTSSASLAGTRSPTAAVERRLSVGTKSKTGEKSWSKSSQEEQERVSRWRTLQEDDLEERMKSKSPRSYDRSSSDGADMNALEKSLKALSVSIPDDISEEEDPDRAYLFQPILSPSSLPSQEQASASSSLPSSQPPSASASPRPGGRFFKSSQSRISPSGQRLLCESPDALKEQMVTEEGRLNRWRFLEETAAAELEYVSADSESQSPGYQTCSSGPSSCNSPALVPSSESPLPNPQLLADKLSQGKAMLPKRWENPIECLSLTLEEVTHIRSVLTKAELESLISHPDLYQQVAKSKMCFTCKTVRFSLFGEWGTKCKFCRRTVCSKCLRKMNVPTDHFRNIPVYTLSPTPLSAEMQEFIQNYIRRAPPNSVPATRDASPSRNNHHQLPSPTSSNPQPPSSVTIPPPPSSSSSDKFPLEKPPPSSANPEEPPTNATAKPPSSGRSFFNKPAIKPLQRSQSALTSGQKAAGSNPGSAASLRSSVKGPLMAICCDCKGMVMEIIRASRSSLALIMTPGASDASPPHPTKGSNRMLTVSQSFRY